MRRLGEFDYGKTKGLFYCKLEGIDIKAGDTVLIPKNTPIFYKGEWNKSKHSQKVIVDHLIPGYSSSEKTVPTTVVWPGSGGYWKEADVTKVSKVDNK